MFNGSRLAMVPYGSVRCGVAGFAGNVVMDGSVLRRYVGCAAIRVKYAGVICSVVRSCKLWFGVNWRGLVSLCLARSSPARSGKVWSAVIPVLFRGVSLRGVRFGGLRDSVIEAWRGLVWHGTVQSCPVRCSEALHSVFLSWHGFVRSAAAGWATVERGFVWHCNELLRRAGVGLSLLKYSMAWFAGLLSRSSIVSCGMVRYGEQLSGVLLSRRCIVWCRELLWAGVKQCPARFAVIVLSFGNVKWSMASCCRLLSRFGIANKGSAMRAAVRCGTAMRVFIVTGRLQK